MDADGAGDPVERIMKLADEYATEWATYHVADALAINRNVSRSRQALSGMAKSARAALFRDIERLVAIEAAANDIDALAEDANDHTLWADGWHDATQALRAALARREDADGR